MHEEVAHQLMATAEKLTHAAEALDRVLEKLDTQQEALNAKVDRIVAAVEDRPALAVDHEEARKLQERVAVLEKTNEELKAQAARSARKTLCWPRTRRASRNSMPPRSTRPCNP